MKSTQLLLAALLCGVPLVASAQIGVGIRVGIPVGEAPPPPLVETYGQAPAGPGWFWVSGHWVRHRGRWIWVNGRWDRRIGYAWSPGHWDQGPNGWIWIDGRWVVPGPGPAVVMVPQTTTTTVTTSAAPPPSEVYVEAAPPAPIVEEIGVAPAPDYFFINGHWGWNGGRWVWSRGYWGRHPHWHPGGGWVGGRWDRRGNGYAWHEGHWR